MVECYARRVKLIKKKINMGVSKQPRNKKLVACKVGLIE